MAGRRRPAKGAFRLRWSRPAELDLEEVHGRLAAADPESARRFARSILDALDRLVKHPLLGAAARDLRPPGRYRHMVVDVYRIIYRIEERVILILRIWDGRRDPAALRPE